MSLQSLEPQLLDLSQPEKIRAIQILTQSLDNPWRGIQKTLGVNHVSIDTKGSEKC